MRVLYIHQFFADRESSLGLIRSYEFSRRLIEAGHEVVMVSSSSRLPASFSERLFARGDVDGIDVRSVRVDYSNYMGYGRRILSFLKFMFGATWLAASAPRPDVVIATSTPLTVGFPGWAAAALRRAPFVFEVRDLWPEAAFQMGALRRRGLLGRLAKALERFLYRRSAAVIALSPGMAAGVVEEGVPSGRVHMIPNCCDLDLFSPGGKDPELVARFGLEGRFVAGYAGAVGPSNALEAQVPEAARVLRDRGRDDVVFLIVGEGRSLSALRAEVQRLGVGDGVVLAGPMPKRDIPRVTRTADALMTLFADVPILATNSPNKFFDALASGRPVIVNSGGWTRDIVTEEEAGLYVPPGDGTALADAVERLADDAELTERLGRNARRVAEQRYGRDLQAALFIGVLEEAAGSRGGGDRRA
ncbi:MAG: glycosyltransferase family 4 protein [Coriobacteriia bacterium]|nr:glycosyltransferase family 4 protein [Coriobacteriia bacterium]